MWLGIWIRSTLHPASASSFAFVLFDLRFDEKWWKSCFPFTWRFSVPMIVTTIGGNSPIPLFLGNSAAPHQETYSLIFMIYIFVILLIRFRSLESWSNLSWIFSGHMWGQLSARNIMWQLNLREFVNSDGFAFVFFIESADYNSEIFGKFIYWIIW